MCNREINCDSQIHTKDCLKRFDTEFKKSYLGDIKGNKISITDAMMKFRSEYYKKFNHYFSSREMLTYIQKAIIDTIQKDSINLIFENQSKIQFLSTMIMEFVKLVDIHDEKFDNIEFIKYARENPEAKEFRLELTDTNALGQSSDDKA